ncbi:hypothetical protein FF011L_01270 [Roseimaritima multifibrata]|uniref:Uncharacterized protein n=1 Tax=Roseimaritima multifibrata TaxID=1930274 RepID=A0A517M922_9BACT|nr:hypothetical protein [Roseimaritima multifibrata]QDS91398.1 hypothetical protein FF011L_01270 [Roseimaritima multifibrata]
MIQTIKMISFSIQMMKHVTVRQDMEKSSHYRQLLGTAALLASVSGGELLAQDACCFQPAYQLKCETVMEPQTVARFRLEYETEMEEKEIVSYRPVLKTRVEQQTHRVARPVTKTTYREERYFVQRPVLETSYRDETVTQTRYVTETAEREEQVTSYRPITETQYRDQSYTVQRPVTETQYRDQSYTVQRPVVETQMQTQQYTALRPVTSYRPQTVDAGGYVAQQVVQPGSVQYGMQWAPGTGYTPGPFGIFARRNPGGPVWTPQVTPPTVQTQLAYRPNFITQQVPQTTYVPEVVQQQVPVQVQRMQTEIVSQKVPVAVTRMQTEVVNQKIPVQITRYEPVTEVRKIPYQVQRPVTETTTRKVPEQKYRWVTEEKVRKVPVTTTEMVYETSSKPVEVQYYENERTVQRIQVPRTKQVWKRVEEQRMVPRQVVQRIPYGYVDPFSASIVHGYSSFDDSVSSSMIVNPPPPLPVPDPSASTGDASSMKPETKLKAVEVNPSGSEDSPSDANDSIFGEEGPSTPLDEAGDGEMDLGSPGGSAADPSDEDEVEVPSLGSPAVHRIRLFRADSQPREA